MKILCFLNRKGLHYSRYLLLLFFMFLMQAGIAQQRFSFELRPGVNFPTSELGDASLSTGFGGEATLAYNLLEHLAVYAGWSWNQFSSNESSTDSDLDFEETGYTYGLQFIHPIGNSNLDYMIRAGAITNHIEVENSDGEIISDSKHGMGYQVELGLPVNFSDRFRFIPSVRYRSLARELEMANTTTDVDLNYLSVGLGLSILF